LAEGFLEDGFGVGDFEKVGVLGLEFDQGGGGKIRRADLDEVSSFEEERFHHLELVSICASMLRWRSNLPNVADTPFLPQL
jgi:hypothetical protein